MAIYDKAEAIEILPVTEGILDNNTISDSRNLTATPNNHHNKVMHTPNDGFGLHVWRRFSGEKFLTNPVHSNNQNDGNDDTDHLLSPLESL